MDGDDDVRLLARYRYAPPSPAIPTVHHSTIPRCPQAKSRAASVSLSCCLARHAMFVSCWPEHGPTGQAVSCRLMCPILRPGPGVHVMLTSPHYFVSYHGSGKARRASGRAGTKKPSPTPRISHGLTDAIITTTCGLSSDSQSLCLWALLIRCLWALLIRDSDLPSVPSDFNSPVE